MKKSKQILPALFAALLVISTLAGCGKNNNGTGTPGIGVGVFPGAVAGATNFIAAGTLIIDNSGGSTISAIYGAQQNLTAGAGGMIGGPQYVRTNQSGDQVVLSLAGTPTTNGVGYSQMGASASVSLSPSTMSYVRLYCGNQPTGISFPNGAGLTPGTPGAIAGTVILRGANGQACLAL